MLRIYTDEDGVLQVLLPVIDSEVVLFLMDSERNQKFTLALQLSF